MLRLVDDRDHSAATARLVQSTESDWRMPRPVRPRSDASVFAEPTFYAGALVMVLILIIVACWRGTEFLKARIGKAPAVTWRAHADPMAKPHIRS